METAGKIWARAMWSLGGTGSTPAKIPARKAADRRGKGMGAMWGLPRADFVQTARSEVACSVPAAEQRGRRRRWLDSGELGGRRVGDADRQDEEDVRDFFAVVCLCGGWP